MPGNRTIFGLAIVLLVASGYSIVSQVRPSEPVPSSTALSSALDRLRRLDGDSAFDTTFATRREEIEKKLESIGKNFPGDSRAGRHYDRDLGEVAERVAALESDLRKLREQQREQKLATEAAIGDAARSLEQQLVILRSKAEREDGLFTWKGLATVVAMLSGLFMTWLAYARHEREVATFKNASAQKPPNPPNPPMQPTASAGG